MNSFEEEIDKGWEEEDREMGKTMFSLFVEGIFGKKLNDNKIIKQKERLTNIIRFFLFIFHPFPSPENSNLNLSKRILFLAQTLHLLLSVIQS
jgi:hypothetical protein